jgi:hypothetical protein
MTMLFYLCSVVLANANDSMLIITDITDITQCF